MTLTSYGNSVFESWSVGMFKNRMETVPGHASIWGHLVTAIVLGIYDRAEGE